MHLKCNIFNTQYYKKVVWIKNASCLISGLICVIEQISWINDSVTNTLFNSLTFRHLALKQCNRHKVIWSVRYFLKGVSPIGIYCFDSKASSWQMFACEHAWRHEKRDKPIQLSESFTLEALRLIQTRDSNHSFKNLNIACTFSDVWNRAFPNSESVWVKKISMLQPDRESFNSDRGFDFDSEQDFFYAF